MPPRRSRSSSPDAPPPAKRASSAGSSVCGYDSEAPEEIQNEALYRACRAYGLGEQFLAAAQDEGTFGEWLDELPFEVAAATARLLKHHARSGAWVEASSSRPATLARPHALAATATARARTARQICRNCRRIATSTPLSPRNPRSHTVHLCDARPASGAGCALSLCVRVRRPSLPGDDCSIYLFRCNFCIW